jgi:hypothetical protein
VGSPLQRIGVEGGNVPRRLLVAGVERSGTTWVGETLGHAPGAVYVHEPDNPFGTSEYSTLTRRATHVKSSLGLYPVLEPGEEQEGCDSYRSDWDLAFTGGLQVIPGIRRLARGPLLRLRDPSGVRELPLGFGMRNALVGAASTVLSSTRRRPDFVIAKTVHATFALEWLVSQYRPDVIVTRRNPIAIVASVLENFKLGYEDRLHLLYDDPRVQARFIEPLGLPVPPKGLERLSGCAWWVGFHCSVLAAITSGHSDWIVVDHTQFARHSGPSFRALFQRLNLPWSHEVDRYLERSNQPGKGGVARRTSEQATERWRTTLGDDAKVVQGILDLFPPCPDDLGTMKANFLGSE